MKLGRFKSKQRGYNLKIKRTHRVKFDLNYVCGLVRMDKLCSCVFLSAWSTEFTVSS